MSSLAVAAVRRGERMRRTGATGRKRWVWVVAGGLAFGALAGYLGTSGSAARVLMLGVVLLPLLLWKRPYLAPAVLLSAAVLVEQGTSVPAHPDHRQDPDVRGRRSRVTSRAPTSCC